MKTNETLTTRELALKWWNSLEHKIKQVLCNRHIAFAEMHNRQQNTLTGKEIEEIWKKEHFEYQISDTEFVLKPNQKQFVQFNSELARKYLNKFDDTAKKHFVLEACNMLSKTDLQYLKACITEIISEK